MYEKALNQLDRKLEGQIKTVRQQIKDGVYNQAPKAESIKRDEDQQSLRSLGSEASALRSRRNSNGFVSDKLSQAGASVLGEQYAASMHVSIGDKKVIYEDPAAALNVTERRWNEMVQ